MTKIPPNEVTFDPTSYIDPNARVFEWRGEIFRAVDPKFAPFFLEQWDKGVFGRLQGEGLLVETEITPFSLGEYDLILKHRKVPFLTYCIEWPPPMLKEAALLTLDINLKLVESGLSLQDAYPWNIFFDGPKPVFVDIGSIVPADPDYIWAAYHQFCRFFLYPLYLCAANMGKISRALLMGYQEGVSDEDLLRTLPFSRKLKNPKMFLRVVLPSFIEGIFEKLPGGWKSGLGKGKKGLKRFITPEARSRFLRGLISEVESIKIEPRRTGWTDYYRDKFPPADASPENQRAKRRVIASVLDRYAPETVLDLGSNTGLYSILAAEKGARVISSDRDEGCVNRLYYEAKEKGLNIVPLVMDTINPSPAFGWCCRQFPSAVERLKCDMVFCLALIHHLVFKQWQDFDRIAETLKLLSNKWVVLEFVPREDEFVKSCWDEKFNWYTLENLEESLKSSFGKIEIFDSYPEGRKLLVLEK